MRSRAPRSRSAGAASWRAALCAAALSHACDDEVGDASDVGARDALARVDAPTPDTPTTDAPSLDAPRADASVVDAPVHDAPSFDAPSFDAPLFDAPLFDAPSFDAPTFDAPAPRDASGDVAPGDAGGLCVAESVRIAEGFTDLTPSVASRLPFVPPAPAVGVGVLSLGVFGDLDGDGATDVVVGTETGPGAPVALRYDRATRALAPLDGPWRAMTRALRGVIDLDGDGRDDLVGTLDDALGTPVIWGGTTATSQLFDDRVRVIASSLWVDDVDHDGWLDVLAGDESYGCGMVGVARAFLQVRPRVFAERAAMIPSRTRVGGGAMVSGPLAGRYAIGTVGEPHACPTAGPSFVVEGARDAEGYPVFAPTDLIGEGFGGPMGATIADFDQDGWFDVAVTTQPRVMFWRGGASTPLDPVDHAFGAGLRGGTLGAPQLPWAVAHVDVDRDGALDVVVTHGNHTVFSDDAPIGPQWTSVYQGRAGSPCLREVDGGFGVSRPGDWHTLSVADLDADGDVDLVVGGRGESARIYRNDIANGLRGLALRLRGTTSNPLGVGAVVESRATPTSPAQRQLVGGASTLVLASPVTFVGLGAATAAHEVTVRWPSGTTQVLRGLAAGAVHTITAPPVLAVEPPSRRARADGASTVRVRVVPRDATGAARAGAAVTARLVAGGGGVAVSPAAGGAYDVTVTAPATPGSSVLEVAVDGAPVAIHPRLWWE